MYLIFCSRKLVNDTALTITEVGRLLNTKAGYFDFLSACSLTNTCMYFIVKIWFFSPSLLCSYFFIHILFTYFTRSNHSKMVEGKKNQKITLLWSFSYSYHGQHMTQNQTTKPLGDGMVLSHVLAVVWIWESSKHFLVFLSFHQLDIVGDSKEVGKKTRQNFDQIQKVNSNLTFEFETIISTFKFIILL